MPDAGAQADTDDAQLARALNPNARLERWLGVGERYELTRFALLRLLGVVYTAAFLSLAWQVIPLLGAHGITPAVRHVDSEAAWAGSRWSAFVADPSLFHFFAPSDAVLRALAWLGVGLAAAVALGVTNAGVMVVLWALYRSFVAVGQIWYGYGWELLLLEAGFLAIFACPLTSVGPFPKRQLPLTLVWLARWLGSRVMLGAGLIKLRGDACWRDLTCLDFHFETQPLPNPLSAWFNALPGSVHAAGVLFNHVAELVLPLCLLAPRRLRALAGLGMIGFQLILILSGNLSFLNWLTIVPLLASFDDRHWARVLPRRWVARSERAQESSAGAHRVALVLAIVIGLLSLGPVSNMLSPRQAMNTGFEPLMLVNSYGAFGSVGRERPELVIEGTRDDGRSADARWQAYELPFKPGDVMRRPGVVSPLQPRLDWQLWFAAMSQIDQQPWLIALMKKLLEGEPALRLLFARDPFADGQPPRYLRILRYRYRFAPLSAPEHWSREFLDVYVPPITLAQLRPQ